MKSSLIKGHCALLAANTMWGLMAPLGKDLLNGSVIPPLSLAALRIVGGALLFWMLTLLTPTSVMPKESIDRRDWPRLIIASLLVIAANQALIILGLSYASPVDGAVVCSTTPIFCLLLATLVFRQRMAWMKVAGVALGFAGMLMFVFGGSADASMHVDNPLLGDSLCLLAQFFGAMYLVFFSDIIQKYSPFTLMKWLFTISAVAMLPFTATDIVSIPWHELTGAMTAELIYVVLCATFLAYLLLPVGQKSVQPTAVAMYNYLQPVVAMVYSLAAGLAIMNGMSVLATALIFIGVWMVSRESKQ